APTVRSWLGDSRARWEADTLVVDTVNYNLRPHAADRGPHLRVRVPRGQLRDDRDPGRWPRAREGRRVVCAAYNGGTWTIGFGLEPKVQGPIISLGGRV